MNFTHSANMNNKKRDNESNENQGAVNRRDLLKGAAVAGLGIAAPIVHGTRAVLRGQEKNPTTLQTSEDGVPPHQPLDLPGLHAYAEKSISAGDTIHFRVSSTLAYRLKVCRLAGGVDDLDADVVLHAFPPSQPSPQPGWAHGTVTNWMSTEESVAWDLDVLHSGSYEITLMYACAPSDTGARIELEIGDQQVSSRLEKAHDPQPPTPREANHKRVETQGPVWVRHHAPCPFQP